MDESCTIPCSSLYANSAYCKQTFHMAKLVPNLLVGRTKKATIDFPKWSYFALAIQIIIVTCFANGSASICEHLNVDAFLSVGGAPSLAFCGASYSIGESSFSGGALLWPLYRVANSIAIELRLAVPLGQDKVVLLATNNKFMQMVWKN